MHTTTHFYEEFPETKIVASAARQGDFATLVFKQQRTGGDQINIHMPVRMASCLETIARVFNECMNAGPGIVSLPDCENPDKPPALSGGQYIGLTRGWNEDVPVGGLNGHGDIRMPDNGPARAFASGGTLIVTPEVAMQAEKFGWIPDLNYPTDGDLVAIKR